MGLNRSRGNVALAFTGMSEITTNIEAVMANAGETGQHAGTTLTASTGLAVRAKRLAEKVSAFMTMLHGGGKARAVWRRKHDPET